MVGLDRFDVLSKVGEGTFGEVFKAREQGTDRIVALKKIRFRRRESGSLPDKVRREVTIQSSLSHPNLVHVSEHFRLKHESGVVTVQDFCQTDLYRLCHSGQNAPRVLPESHVKSITRMLLKGVCHLHGSGVVHRDLKPSNLLLDAGGCLKIGDFGLVRRFDSDELLTNQVATRWYRSPELLFGARRYGVGTDLWAIACVVAELLCPKHRPLFKGHNDIDQLFQIVTLLGTPDTKAWPEALDLPDFHKISFHEMAPGSLSDLLPSASPQAVDFVRRFLHYPEHERMSAQEALDHEWFSVEPLPVHHSELADLVAEVPGLDGNDGHCSNDEREPAIKFDLDFDFHAEFASCAEDDSSEQVHILSHNELDALEDWPDDPNVTVIF